SFEDIVTRFECIGKEAPNSYAGNVAATQFQDELADLHHIDDLQASLFAARVLDYVPESGATEEDIRADLAMEMLDVIVNPQSRQPVNNVTPTKIAGLDRFRQMGAGTSKTLSAMRKTHLNKEEFKTFDISSKLFANEGAWKRNEIGAEIIMMRRRDPLNPADARKMFEDINADLHNKKITVDTVGKIRAIIEAEKKAGSLNGSDKTEGHKEVEWPYRTLIR
ncbi:hypothetical protein KKA47_04815, partial [bacterium]|nr:hypothetical protein [bacterium]